jgi:hypothetical protein
MRLGEMKTTVLATLNQISKYGSLLVFKIALLSLAVMPIKLMAAESTPFITSNRLTTTSTIEWQTVEHVNDVCQQHSKQLGYASFGYRVDGCAFWKEHLFGHQCIIYTAKKITLEILGHEIRHCFMGAFHK